MLKLQTVCRARGKWWVRCVCTSSPSTPWKAGNPTMGRWVLNTQHFSTSYSEHKRQKSQQDITMREKKEKYVRRMGQLLHYTFSKYLELVSILIYLLSVKQTSSASKIDCYTLNLIDFLSWITNPTSIIHSEFRNLGKWTLWSASAAFSQAFKRHSPLKFYLLYSFSCIAVAIIVVKPCISSS